MAVIEINGPSVFKLEEARALLPVIYRITKTASEKVDLMIDRIEALGGRNEALAADIERQINGIIQDWQGKVERLGGLPKGLWIADFDSGTGYYCWKYPESTIEYWHKYSDGFSKRIHVDDLAPSVSAIQAPGPEIEAAR